MKIAPRKFRFNTTAHLTDTNAVGNVYFSTYFDWQGRAREEFFHAAVPNVRQLLKSGLIPLTRDAHMSFLESAYLFDRIQIEVFVVELRKGSVKLVFEFYNEDTQRLLARGWQKLAFAFDGRVIPIPDAVVASVVPYVASSSCVASSTSPLSSSSKSTISTSTEDV